MAKINAGKGKSGGKGVSAKTGPHPCRLIPPGLFAFFFVLEAWVFALYLAGAGEGWPDSGLGFLARHLTALGVLTFASALSGIAFGIAETLLFKRAGLLRFVFVYAVLGAAGLALGLAGGVFHAVAAGRMPEGL